MGPGVPHSVISLQKPGCRPVSTVMSGSHCLNRFSMAATLHASIQHAFWHDVWTNATHDDRDFSIARMLAWQVMHMEAMEEWPFKGEDLYALLVMGLVPFVLRSLPFAAHILVDSTHGEEMELDEVDAELAKAADATVALWLQTYDPTTNSDVAPTPSKAFLTAVRDEMPRISQLIISKLPSSAREAFRLFWTDTRELFIEEYERRCEYNRSLV